MRTNTEEGSPQGTNRAWLDFAKKTSKKTEAAGRILKCIGIYCLPTFNQMQQSWLQGTS